MSSETRVRPDVTGDQALTAALKAKALDLGADLVGVGPCERWEGAPTQMHPLGHWPQSRHVVVVAIHHPGAAVELGGIPDAHTLGPYAIQGSMNERLEYIQFHLARWLEKRGHGALPIAASNIWRYRPYKEVVRPFGPDLSNIHAAVCVGLGEIGYHGLLMTPEFGTWERLCCMITDAPLVDDPMYNGPALCDRCNACVVKCDEQCGGALAHEVTGEVVLNIAGKELRYAEKNLWRCAWSEHFGLDAYLDIPEVVTEEVILETLAKHGRRGGTMGPCLKYCRPPHLRGRPTHKEVPADAPPDRRLTEELRRIARDGRVSVFGVAGIEHWDEGAPGDPRAELPGCRSVIVIGVDWPADSTPSGNGPLGEPCTAAQFGVSLLLEHTAMDLTRALDQRDYFSVGYVRTDPVDAAEKAGLLARDDGGRLSSPRYDDRLAWRVVLTQAPLAEGAVDLMPSGARVEPTLDELRALLGDDGADLIGVASVFALADTAAELRTCIDEEVLKVNVVRGGPTHGAVEAKIVPRPGARVFAPQDWLPGARSVIVLGMAYPEATLDRAGEEPADAVGPYAFARYQVARDIGINALVIARELAHRGFRAAITYDVTGVGSLTQNPRFLTPDIFSGRIEAAAAGLATIGIGGFAITPEYGVRVQWVAVVTDADLPATGAPEAFDPCEGCAAPCIPVCPVQALSAEATECAADRCWAARDLLRCDWAKRYALVGDEGPKYMGSTTDVPPPAGPITAEDIAAAVRTRDPIQRHLDCILEPCLKACHKVLRERGIG